MSNFVEINEYLTIYLFNEWYFATNKTFKERIEDY
jgi:hypothetical protein